MAVLMVVRRGARKDESLAAKWAAELAVWLTVWSAELWVLLLAAGWVARKAEWLVLQMAEQRAGMMGNS